MTTTKRTIRLSQKDVEALEMLFQRLNISGQRGTRLNAGIRHLAETASAAMAETVAAYEIAAGATGGEEWDELIDIIRPEYGEE